MRPSRRGGGGDWRVIVGLPSELTELAQDFKDCYDAYIVDRIDLNDATRTKMTSYEEVTEQHAKLQDACPFLFAHNSHEKAIDTIERLDLLNGTGLPERY